VRWVIPLVCQFRLLQLALLLPSSTRLGSSSRTAGAGLAAAAGTGFGSYMLKPGRKRPG
jgi:hypothetical protein